MLEDTLNERPTGTESFRGKRRLGLNSKLNKYMIQLHDLWIWPVFPNILSQRVEGQDKDEPISQNFILKNTIRGALFRKDNF